MHFSKLLLATNNKHKIAEISAILTGSGITILTKDDFPDFPEIEEEGETLAENALHKARTIYQKYGIPAVADDTGLEVRYLDDAPGVYSARYAGEGCTFEDNYRKLLKELDGVPVEQRLARFVTVIAVCYDNGEKTFQGDVWGYITTEPKGTNGFGYDPVFYHPRLNKTFAEMSAGEKNNISHRAAAIIELASWLRKTRS